MWSTADNKNGWIVWIAWVAGRGMWSTPIRWVTIEWSLGSRIMVCIPLSFVWSAPIMCSNNWVAHTKDRSRSICCVSIGHSRSDRCRFRNFVCLMILSSSTLLYSSIVNWSLKITLSGCCSPLSTLVVVTWWLSPRSQIVICHSPIPADRDLSIADLLTILFYSLGRSICINATLASIGLCWTHHPCQRVHLRVCSTNQVGSALEAIRTI